ncbi:5-formyltetrahydrofolate cyclo-ligase [Bifidobacterium eulemuris]|uniref:5-formyltetrahydrofolate cyclo-ligase n=1 Tax=Bifidobacterium eulemuris TaxID=1765219 RepID=A0A261G3W6_9BIFI|nr:5-formyltetrahydrofolate cyclo-ligase [Bifidobacterium eulemuris]OZG65915.1 5-formyltetrahydrofolate cyclo-ligase [Bifidobacterium eulemuris]QOL31983.1 5-formyltetrahydrofolate cyclo-ligase [Bifidobacterium eulemuris]
MEDLRTKSALRTAALARRKTVPVGERERAGVALASRIGELPAAATVAAYVSMGSEIPMEPALRAWLDAGVRVLVPRLGSGLRIGWSVLPAIGALRDVDSAGVPIARLMGEGDAGDARAESSESSESSASSASAASSASRSQPSNPRRPQEPDGEVLPPEALAQADLIVVPALAVDRGGVRLGRGGGWYDRALEHRRADAPVVAVVWPWEIVDGPLPHEAHDVPVDAALSVDGVVMFARRDADCRPHD